MNKELRKAMKKAQINGFDSSLITSRSGATQSTPSQPVVISSGVDGYIVSDNLNTASEDIKNTMRNRYDWAINDTLENNKAGGLFMDALTGDIRHWDGQSTYLSAPAIAWVEAERGRQGAMYNHFGIQAPMVATTPSTTTSGGLTPDKVFGTYDTRQAAADAAYQVAKQNYAYLMNTPLDQLTQLGYKVIDTPELGYTTASIFKVDANGTGKVFLALQDIQQIENETGTGGALFLHFQQPAIAKDTAGQTGGSSTTFNGQTGDPVNILPEVQALPPVQNSPSGAVFTESSMGSIVDSIGKYWYLWIVAAVVISIIYIKFHKK